MQTPRKTFSLAAAAMMLLANVGHAESGAATSAADDKEARKLFFQGDRMYEEGKYEEAVESFEKAYELSHRPELKFNLANAYERLGQYEEALRALRDYAPAAPPGDREKIEARLKTLEERAEQRRNRGAEKAAKEAQPVQPAYKPEAPAEVTSNPPILAYSLLGVGAVGVGLGVVFGVGALGAKSDAEDQCTKAGGTYCKSNAQGAIDDASSKALIADISFAVGAVAAGTGLVLLLVHNGSGKKEQAAALHAAPRAGGGEVQFVAHF